MALACLLSGLLPAQAAPLRVQVVLSERGGAYQEFSDALRDALRAQQVIVNVSDGNAADDADLIVAVGMKSASASVAANKPVLNVFVPKAGYDKLAKPAGGARSSAIYIDQPLERQVSLLVAALPKAGEVGVLYTAPPPGLSSLRRLLAERNLQLHEQAVGQSSLFDALEDVLAKSDVLLVLPDIEIYNAGTIRNILLAAYRKQVPLIGISQSYVKAGALCAIYSTPAQIAQQAAEAVGQFAASGKLPPSQYPKEFEVSVNAQVARSLDLPIKDAENLHGEVRRAQ
ncbi:ABC transporter substrate binding protein [mine drainage metagenome]|uniref:ABC transporter substrate binding protein n=1 Tax=mine drainage metagenome TaxID=410659 RepID=A0A1J5T467_9ZZZZ